MRELLPPQQSVPSPASQPERILRPPLSGGRAATASTIGLARGFDPEKGVDKGISGMRRRRFAQALTGWIAPVSRIGRILSVAARIDNEMLSTDSLRHFHSVGDVD